MQNTKENCVWLQLMCQALEEDWCRTPRTIHTYREQLGICVVDCGWMHKDCKEAVLFFMNKTSSIIETK